ncbi:DUF3817 domain-containing protein [Salegentibacter sp. F188]|uniref:DUF3817 domain-containing protein n=1 Tax=Autumnicola patrickiae TaxID=3075591 RepID=A0ABU3E256_9FLAO|nr:DUF3817 domain-containing protein [Salegentibacter sp. F188]MDT0690083.1 DUF3817 domain-containing protein [Salegentibacter sp. F188]
MRKESKRKTFKWISILEGLSYLILLFIAMPLKYFFDQPDMVRFVGMAHGVLFIAYVIGAMLLYKTMSWNLKDLSIILLCSLLPFGPFYVDKKYL